MYMLIQQMKILTVSLYFLNEHINAINKGNQEFILFIFTSSYSYSCMFIFRSKPAMIAIF